MSTCRGCWRDERVPFDVGVLMGIGYEDGGADDPYVSHAPTARCAIAGHQPHRMSECGEFDAPDSSVRELLRERALAILEALCA